MKTLLIGGLFLFAIYALNNFRAFQERGMKEWVLAHNILTDAQPDELCALYAEDAEIHLNDERLADSFHIEGSGNTEICAYFQQTKQAMQAIEAVSVEEKFSQFYLTLGIFPFQTATLQYTLINQLDAKQNLELTSQTTATVTLGYNILGSYTIKSADYETETGYRRDL